MPVVAPAVTIPEELIVAILVFVLAQAPDAGVALNVVVVYTHIDDEPPAITGVGFTDTTAVPDIPTAHTEYDTPALSAPE